LRPHRSDNSTRNTFFALAAVELNQAVLGGEPTLGAMLRLLAVCAAVMWGVFGPPIRRIEALGEKVPVAILSGGLAVQFTELLVTALRSYSDGLTLFKILFVAGVAACAGAALLAVTSWATSRKAWFIAIVAMHFGLGVVYLRVSSPPQIDVYEFQQRGSAALIRGANPYTATYPNIYGDNTTFYSPGSYSGDRLLFGFPYPPLVLFLCLPSFLLTGDVRYAHLAAVAVSGLLIGLARQGSQSKLSALLFLFSPTVFWIVDQSWTDPFVILLISAVIVQRGLGVARFLMLGLLMASKQYALLAVPAAWFLIPARSWRAYTSLILRSGAVFLAITLPLALWNFGAFLRSVVILQTLQPFRTDSLSFLTWLTRLGLPQGPVWPAFLAVVIAGVLLFKRLPPSPANFAGSLAVGYLLFFCLNKQAFMNYYFLVEACLCWAIAAPVTIQPQVTPASQPGLGRKAGVCRAFTEPIP
jgi:hypothetical protein